jgi:hypothetical protein
MQKLMSHVFIRAKRNMLRKTWQRLQSKYDSTYLTIPLLKADHDHHQEKVQIRD